MDLFKSPEYTKHVNRLMEEWRVPGLSMAVFKDDEVVSKGYGAAHLDSSRITAPNTNPNSDESGRPATGDTLFDIASSSKSMTAAAVSLLIEDDDNYPQVQWDTPVSKLLPEDFAMASQEYTDGVTIEDILSHRSGLPSHDYSYISPRAKEPDTMKSVVRNIRNLEIGAPIRTKFMYCNMMFTVAAYLVETISGMPYEDFLHKHFFEPLNMTSSHVIAKNAFKAGLGDHVAQPYVWDEEKEKYKPVLVQDAPEALGAGLVVTSANDYIKYVKAFMNQEAPFSKGIYSGITKPRSFENLDSYARDRLDPWTSIEMYAAGWECTYYRGYQVISHDGSDPGVGSTHCFLPKLKFGFVIFGNANTMYNLKAVVSHELIDAALGVPPAERTDWNAREHEWEKTDEEKGEEARQNLRKELCPDTDGKPEPQTLPLENYCGWYENAGYHGVAVEIRNNKLIVDMDDRTMGFTLTLEHFNHQTKYIAHVKDWYEGNEDQEFATEFILENDKAVKLGIDLEEDLDDKIWFERTKPANHQDLPSR